MRKDIKLTREFVADLRRAFELASEEVNVRYVHKVDIALLATLKPANSFYISLEEGRRIINRMKKGNITKKKSEMTVLKYNDLFEVYQSIKKDLPTAPESFIIKLSIDCPAPRFYITPERVLRLLNKYIGV